MKAPSLSIFMLSYALEVDNMKGLGTGKYFLLKMITTYVVVLDYRL